MRFNNIIPKQFIIYEAITDILKIFADTEIGGQYEIDTDKICEYLDDLKSFNDYCMCKTKEEIYERFTQDILNGYPVWRMLKLSDWTLNMVEKSFNDQLEKEYEEVSKIYKCLTCKYQKVTHTSLGTTVKCICPSETETQHSNMRFKPKKRCKNYSKKEE